MKISLLCAFLFLCFLCSNISATTAAEGPCHPLPGVDAPGAEYCIYPGESSDLLFYLHGAEGSARRWGEEYYYTAQVRREWRKKGVAFPTVVSFSFGPEWLLGPVNSSPEGRRGLLVLVVDQLLPFLENEAGGARGRRLLLGESMGGFNGLQLGLKTERFAKVAALCAPMGVGVTPFSSDEEMERYIQASSAYHYYGEGRKNVIWNTALFMRKLTSAFFANEVEFREADPIPLAERLNGPKQTAFYLAAGLYDPFLTLEGNERLAEVLKEKGAAVEWRPQWGGHCAIDIPSLAEFLAR